MYTRIKGVIVETSNLRGKHSSLVGSFAKTLVGPKGQKTKQRTRAPMINEANCCGN